MLVHRVNYVIGVREIVAGEILWPTFHSQGAELDDAVLSDTRAHESGPVYVCAGASLVPK